MTISTDYTGRTVDLMITQGIEPIGQQELSLSLADEAGASRVVSGVQKAVQRFLLTLLTDVGSQSGDTEYGTSFMAELQLGSVGSPIRFQSAFQSAVSNILLQQNQNLTGEEPDDEILSAIELTSYSFPTADSVSMQVTLTTRAGSSRVVLLPVTLAIR